MRLIRFRDFNLDDTGVVGTTTEYSLRTITGLVPLYGGGFDTQGGVINNTAITIPHTLELADDASGTIRAKLLNLQQAAMLGRSVLHAIDRDGSRLYTWAKIDSMSAGRGVGNLGYQQVDLSFSILYPYWLRTDDAPTLILDTGAAFDTTGLTFTDGNSSTVNVTSSPTTLTITNAGPVAVLRNMITLATDTGTMLNGITVENTTTHEQIDYSQTYDLENGETLYIDTLGKSIHVDGTDGYNNATIPTNQKHWLHLAPGDNDIEISATTLTGTNIFTWYWSRHYIL